MRILYPCTLKLCVAIFTILVFSFSCSSDVEDKKQVLISPEAPSGLEATTVTFNSIALHWINNSTDAEKIEIWITRETDYELIGEVSGSETGFEYDELEKNTYYNDAGFAWSNIISIITPLPWGTFSMNEDFDVSDIEAASPSVYQISADLLVLLTADLLSEDAVNVLNDSNEGSSALSKHLRWIC